VDFITQSVDCSPSKCYPEAGGKPKLGCPLQGKQAAAQRFDDALPGTSLQDLDTTILQNIVGKMSAISKILPLEEVLR